MRLDCKHWGKPPVQAGELTSSFAHSMPHSPLRDINSDSVCSSSPLRMTQLSNWLAVPWAETCPVPVCRRPVCTAAHPLGVQGHTGRIASSCTLLLTSDYHKSNDPTHTPLWLTRSILHYLTPTFQNPKDPMKGSIAVLAIATWLSAYGLVILFFKRKLSKEYRFIFMFLKIDINTAWFIQYRGVTFCQVASFIHSFT